MEGHRTTGRAVPARKPVDYIPSGKTSPRLILDLLEYDARYLQKNGKNLLADPAPQFRGSNLPPRTGVMDCRHTLIRKDEQTHAPGVGEEPDKFAKYVVASYCPKCRHHFSIIVNFSPQNDVQQSPCRLSDVGNPMHHLQLIKSTNAGEHLADKYNNLLEAHQFACSAVQCPVTVEIKISPPRLYKEVVSLLTDPAKVDARGRRAISLEPERYKGRDPYRPVQVLLNLRKYLTDAKAGAQDPSQNKRIAARNKGFVLAFADEFNGFFEYLDFKSVREDSGDPLEEPAFYWYLPIITSQNEFFIEDVIHELDFKISERTEQELRNVNHKISLIAPPALKDIERSLGYYNYPTKSRLVDLTTLEEHPYYASLGITENFTDEMLSWAYERQCECDPSNKPYYLDCLSDLAKGRKSSDLEMKATMAISRGEYGLNDIEEAYKFFALEPHSVEGEDHIIGLYKSRIEAAPRQKDEARNALLIIAKSRNSSKIEKVANDRTLSFQEALEFLSVSADTASDSIEAAAIAMSLDSDNAKVARALRVIANERGNDYTLQRAAATMESGNTEYTLDIGEAYNRLQISERHAPDETVFTYYQSLCDGAPSGSKESYREALRAIAQDRDSNFLFMKLDNPNADVQSAPPPTNQPVGLDNIGNTCYLNSLLQYYYTVNAVREVVIDFEHHRMPLNEEDIKKKRVGGRAVSKTEIIKAQKFVGELHDLFENLKTAPTRSIKPTRELAELTIFSSAAEAYLRLASVSSPSGPPNSALIPYAPVYGPEGPPPAGPSRPSPKPTEDIEMIDRPEEKPTESADNCSETTLVDIEPVASSSETVSQNKGSILITDSPSTVKDEDYRMGDTPEDGILTLVNGDTLSPSPEEADLAAEKPPPVPPRNKSGLVIQTNNSKHSTSEAEKWKFGSQQDVTEVIGNVMFRLQCAIKPTSIDQVSGEQIDSVRDTFFGENSVYLRKAQKLEQKVEAWANLIVFPGTVSRDIYEALDIVFDEQTVEIDNTETPQYTSIHKLPPILQIQIQRTAFDSVKQTAWKNRNPVIFPEVIYLDRYMDSEDPNSELMLRRKETWKWKAQLKALEARQAALKGNLVETELSVADALMGTKDYINALQEAEIPGIPIDDSLPGLFDQRLVQITQELENLDRDITRLRQNLTDQFTNMREYEYNLQTVFIHRGEAGGGHYWIYVYDFENDIWREYNDERVSVVRDRRQIFDYQAASGGTPYYLAYVRSTEKNKLVDAVCRDVRATEMMDVTASWADGINGDNTVLEDEGYGGATMVRHTENRQRELRPKPPAAGDGVNSSDWDNDFYKARAEQKGSCRTRLYAEDYPDYPAVSQPGRHLTSTSTLRRHHYSRVSLVISISVLKSTIDSPILETITLFESMPLGKLRFLHRFFHHTLKKHISMAWRCSGNSNKELIDNLFKNGLIMDERVRDAMMKVDRAHYTPHVPSAYEDSPQAIGHTATISAPHMHASACESLLPVLKPGSRVLDVGSGSGYLTAVLAELVCPDMGKGGKGGKVVGLEHISALRDLGEGNMRKSERGRELLDKGEVKFVLGDGRKGYVDEGEDEGWDAIHVGAAAKEIHPELIEQLKRPGRMFIPVEDQKSLEQFIWTVDKDEEGQVTKKQLYGVRIAERSWSGRHYLRVESQVAIIGLGDRHSSAVALLPDAEEAMEARYRSKQKPCWIVPNCIAGVLGRAGSSRVESPKTSLEYRERAFTAASRRSDRSLEARMDSARKASEVHKQRTGRYLNITEEAVANEEMYEEVDDRTRATIRHPYNIFASRSVQQLMSPGGAINPSTNTNQMMGQQQAFQPNQPQMMSQHQAFQPNQNRMLSQQQVLQPNQNQLMRQQQVFQPNQNQVLHPGDGMDELIVSNQATNTMTMPSNFHQQQQQQHQHQHQHQHQQPSPPMMQFMNSQQTMQMIPDANQEFQPSQFNYGQYQSPKTTQQWNSPDQAMNHTEKGVADAGNFDTTGNGEFDTWFDFEMEEEGSRPAPQ
ncbi:hypothetical protein B7494_g4308 [Chlorociboria aeruginascens]|nr:hypothetical protein B7494_g4308 [Chlorociboria aeruginascens]